MKLVLLGPPGAGKGTQAARIAEAIGATRASSGDLFRLNQRDDTELGRTARFYMDQGVLVPDEITIKMVLDWISDPQQAAGFVLDGFPRNLTQAEALEEALIPDGGLDKVLYISVPNEELTRRLGGRLLCRDCQTPYHQESSPPTEAGICDACGGEVYQRADDAPDVIARRLSVYFDETAPLVEYYRKSGKLTEIDGEGTIEEVGQTLVAALG